MSPQVPSILLDGSSLTRAQLVAVAHGSTVSLDSAQLQQVHHAAQFLASKASLGVPIYGVNTGFGSNADKLLGSQRARDALGQGNDSGMSLLEELQHNLIVSHAVCVGEPASIEMVRVMLAIRINTLMRGHSGVRVATLEALAQLLNRNIIPVIPEKGSVGASGDLAPLSHLAIVLLGGGEAFVDGQRVHGAQALEHAGMQPLKLSYKEGLALNNGTAQMLAASVLALHRLETLLATANLAAAMSLDAFAGRSAALHESAHALRPHPGQVACAGQIRGFLEGSTLVDVPYHLVPHFRTWTAQSWLGAEQQLRTFDLAWDYVTPAQRAGREAFYRSSLPFKGGKKQQPQDAYSLRCAPQVHGAVHDAIAQACRVIDVELNAVTDNPLVFPDVPDSRAGEQIISAGHFHGMPLALVMAYVKAAIPVLASISERRLNKLVDEATNDGMPAFLVGNEDGTDSGFMIVQYTAAALVNDLATRAHPASVYSIPTSANAEDHVSMGTNETRHVLEMCDDLAQVLALELYTAAQALDLRKAMQEAARELAGSDGINVFAGKMRDAPRPGDADHAQFVADINALRHALRDAGRLEPGQGVAAAHAHIREQVPFLARDRAMAGDIAAMCALVDSGTLLEAASGQGVSAAP